MKKTPILATFLLLALVVPTLAFAGPGHYWGGGGPRGEYGWQQPAIAPEKQDAFRKIMDEHYDKAKPLYRQMAEKRMELEYLSRLEKTEPQTITKLLGEIKVLNDRLDDLRKSTDQRLEKEIGIAAGDIFRHGPGRGGYGYGPYGFDGPRHDRGHGYGPRHQGRW